MRLLADYVLRTRTDEVPVSAPLQEERSGDRRPGRITLGFSAQHAQALQRAAGQEALLVRNIQSPGEPLARLRLLAVDPRTSRLVAEVVATHVAEQPSSATADPRTPPVRSRAVRQASVGSRAVLGLVAVVLGVLVLVAVGWAMTSRADRKCTSSRDCPDGFACVSWGAPPPSSAVEPFEYRSCERVCDSDRDCPGAEQCFLGEHGPSGVKVCRSPR